MTADSLPLADLDVAPYVHRLECLGLENTWAGRPAVAGWYERLKARPSWGTAIQQPHIQKWVDLMAAGGKEAWPKVEEILREHVVSGRRVERLMLQPEDKEP